MAFGALNQEEEAISFAGGSSAATDVESKFLDLRILASFTSDQCLAHLQQLMESDLQPYSLYLPLNVAIVEEHPDAVKKVLCKLKVSVRAVAVLHYSLDEVRSSSAQLDVLGEVLQMPLQRLRLHSCHDYGLRGASVSACFVAHIEATLTTLDLRCSASYFNEACTKLLRIHRNTLKQVRLPERPNWALLGAVAQCRELESLGLPDLRLLSRLERGRSRSSLSKVREILVTSMSSARRRRQRATHKVIMRSSVLQQVTHLSLEERFWSDVAALSAVGLEVRQLTLRGFSDLRLRNICSAILRFPALNVVRLFHCEVRDWFTSELERSRGLQVEVICRRPSSPGVLMIKCSRSDCDSCMENIEDMPIEDRLKREKEITKKLEDEVSSVEKRCALERATVGQRHNPMWFEKRKFRLTASHFAAVCKRRDSTLCHNLVKRIVFPPSIDHIPAVKWGQEHEKDAKKNYKETTGREVEDCGLFVHKVHTFLGASPDGLVGEEGIMEIKCYHLVQTPFLQAIDDPKMSRKLPVELIKSSTGQTLRIKADHPFHFQIQGQLAISEKKWCDLVLHGPTDQVVVRVYRDDEFWGRMWPQLRRFYTFCLLPEYADSRIRRSLQAREAQFTLKALDDERRMRRNEHRRSAHYVENVPLYTQFANFGFGGFSAMP